MVIRERKPEDSGNGPTPGQPKENNLNPVSAFRRALEDYRDAVSLAWRHEDASYRVNQVLYGEHSGIKSPPDYASYLEQQAALARKLQEAWIPPEFHEAVSRAFLAFTEATKEAWAGVDSGSLTPAELAHISQILAQASSMIAIPIARPSDRPDAAA
jgi:hypothetical protein